jgi:hypothetical protein
MSEPESKIEMISIPIERLKSLLEIEAVFCALERGGVDNWSWYGESISEHYEEPCLEFYVESERIRYLKDYPDKDSAD